MGTKKSRANPNVPNARMALTATAIDSTTHPKNANAMAAIKVCKKFPYMWSPFIAGKMK
jgi:hypothetical protein